MKYFGGIEGGATHSRLIICSEDGECVVTTTGLGTNHWMVGIAECARRIADMIERAKTDANIPQETRLTSLGLSLSGCEQEATNYELEMELRTSFPDIADHYYVCSDTMGSIFTASPSGGMVLISGTGSNALLKNPDGTSFSCGGWGHFLGDEGSAWYISHRAMKLVFDDMDNFSKAPFPVETVWKLIQEHFNIQTRLDLLPHCYAKFDKPFYASLCKKLSHAAEQGDELSKFLFREAGAHIATHINSLAPKVHNDLVREGDLNVVCVGSVWLSWPLLKDGFIQELKKAHIPFGLKLIRITKCMAYGACYLGADSIKFPLPRNYLNNYKVMYHYGQGHTNGNVTMNGNHSNSNE
ncbi:N-acetyl-D-glucosamine kinase [Lucilia sericata]|uniref:N-acetyl-D-glucosamine kinase n=1 Tax=Lucilia sericata TaxID=13632 RepID=UPI0018A84721|nr:N-acetyl-D-glucosamine kinase [Lucilia sericata]XP_037816086.1 N-acetyl-D-glucosamine kinase [Lucilia sericata]